MPVRVDTGFFFAIEDQHPVTIEIWKGQKIITSAIVLYELQKKLLKGHLKNWSTILKDIERSAEVIPVTTQIALKAAHLAHGTGMPGLDALILASLLDADCNEIYTADPHFKLYQRKGVRIIDLVTS